MNNDDILKLYKDSRDSFVQKIKAYNRDFYNEVNSKFVGRNFSEKLYQYIYGRFECEMCGADVKFISFGEGYRKYCCKKCSNEATKDIRRSKIKKDLSKWETKICPECNNRFDVLKIRNQIYCSNKCSAVVIGQNVDRMEKIKKTKFERYGDCNYVNLEKAKQTNLDRYGVDNPAYLSETKNKIKETNLERYGVEYSFQSETIKDKIKQVNLERYGVENASQSPEIREKIKQTNLERYGVGNVFISNEIKTKSRNTLLYKHGVEYPSQCASIKDKISISSKRTHYNSVLSRLNSIGSDVIPLFNYDEYTTVSRENKYKFKCKSCDTVFESSINSGKSPRCIVCNPSLSGTSSLENEVYDYISNIYDGTIIRNNRKLLNGKEIDIYIPDLKIGIEFNGIYWHGESGGKKHKKYHLTKTEECESNNIRLIHIFEDEWVYKKEILKSKIKHILKLNNLNSIYARNCYVSPIENGLCNSFLDQTHIQGKSVASVKLGLFNKETNDLVSVMTFAKLRKSLGTKSIDDHYELIRYSTDLNVNVVGGMSKILAYFIKKYNPISIITYADRRYTYKFNNIYEKVNFEFVGETKPNYWYFKCGYIDRYYRYNFAKHTLSGKLETYDEKLSEWQNMKFNGYDRIWDCGSLKYQIIF